MALVNYISVLVLALSLSNGQSVERRLVDSLKLKELTCCIPQQNTSHTIVVKYGITLIDMISFNRDTGIAEFLIWEKISWTDFRLTWDPTQFNGVKSIRVNPDMLWLPDLKFYGIVNAEVERATAKAVVYSNGMILWIPPITLRKRCLVEGDEVKCNFKVGSWTYDGYTIDLNHYEDKHEMDITDLVQYDNQIQVTKNTAKKNTVHYDCCPEPYPNIGYELAFTKSSATATKALPVIIAVVMSIKSILF